VNKVKAFENAFIEYMEAKHRDVLNAIRGGAWGDAEIGAIEAAAKEIIPAYAN
jgi:F-type H+-transporting ATPase subunit alpha